MTPNLLDELEAEAKWLRKAAAEIANAGHAGWGNTCLQAAECIERNAPALADMAKRMEAAERDGKRLDWLETYREAYGFQNEHLGNRWHIEGAYRSVRDALDDEMRGSDAIDATQEGEG